MKNKTINSILILLIFALMIPTSAIGQVTTEIRVAPNVLNILNQGEVVTIHTDIAYSLVDYETVFLNGIEIQSYKSDDRGFFVAKFNMDSVQALEGLVFGEYNTLTLVGVKYDGAEFVGTKDIMVIKVEPVKTGKI